ncbi:MAG: type II secretion system F family protein, partial [Verrucomicrobiota bacterium]
ELGHLIHAGLPLASALDILIQSPEMGDNRPLLAGIRDRLREGVGLADALQQQSRRISDFEISIVSAGERSGELARIFERLAEFLEEEEVLRAKVKTALIYPIFILVVSALVGFIVFGVLMPSFSKLLTEANVAFPPITRFTLFLGDLFLTLSLPAIALAIGGLFLARRHLARNEDARLRLNRFWFGFPLVGKALTALVNLRFSRTLALLLDGGIPLVESMALAGRATGSLWVAREVKRESDAVRQGEPLAEAVARVVPLSGSLPGWIRAGEAGGELARLLNSAAERFQQQWDRTIARCLAAIEPTLILIVGLFVLLLALAIMLPILSMNEALIQ